jgi:chaperone protein EcpD
VRSRLKIFYRPAQLTGDPNRAAESLHWQYSRQGNAIKVLVNNPTPYHVSFSEIKLSLKAAGHDEDDEVAQDASSASTSWIGQPLTGMVKPLSQAEFVFSVTTPQASSPWPAPLSVHYATVNDWGGFVPAHAPIALGQP